MFFNKVHLGKGIEGFSSVLAEVSSSVEVHLVCTRVERLPAQEPVGPTILVGTPQQLVVSFGNIQNCSLSTTVKVPGKMFLFKVKVQELCAVSVAYSK